MHFQLEFPSRLAEVYYKMRSHGEALQISVHAATGLASESSRDAVEVFRV